MSGKEGQERQRERERQTDRQTDRQSNAEMEMGRDRGRQEGMFLRHSTRLLVQVPHFTMVSEELDFNPTEVRIALKCCHSRAWTTDSCIRKRSKDQPGIEHNKRTKGLV